MTFVVNKCDPIHVPENSQKREDVIIEHAVQVNISVFESFPLAECYVLPVEIQVRGGFFHLALWLGTS